MIHRGMVWLLLLPVLGWGQASGTGSFNGTVVDSTGAVVPGAMIGATNSGTGMGRTATSNEHGFYTITGLPPGTYEVKAEFSGFATEVKKDVTLLVGATLTLDFTLRPAATSQQVEVVGAGALMETTQSEVKGTIQTRELENLPLLNRNFSGLVTLMPGIRPAAPWDPTKQTIGGLSIGGSRGRNLNTTVDGGDSKDNVVGGLLQNFTVEGIQEFKVALHRFSAAEGRSSGASLTIVSKSGTNDLHGSAFLFARDETFQAKDFFARRDHLQKPPFSRQQFGGSLGGPLKKNRAFAFGAIERIREDTGITVPNPLFNEIERLALFGAKAAHQIPKPFRETMYTIKGDVKFSDADSFTVRWAQQRNNRDNDQINTPNHDLSVPTFDINHLYSLVASETRLFGARKLNQFTFQVNDFLNLIDSPVTPPPTGNLITPSVAIGRGSLAIKQQTTQRKLQFRDDFSLQTGNHSLKFGGDYNRFLKYGGEINFGLFGSFTLFDDPSVILSNPARFPQGLQTPGIVSNFAQATAPSDFNFFGAQQASGYFQDDWRITRRLTLNLGLRYDVDINFYDLDELPQNRTLQVLQRIGSSYARLPHTDRTNLAPRVGFAYDPSGKGTMVIRGGYGLFFDESFINPIFPVVTQSKRVLNVTVTRTNTAPGQGELANFRLGIDPPPSPPGGLVNLPPGGRSSGRWIDPDYRSPYAQHASIGVSRQLGHGLVLDADYTHVLGLHEFRQYLGLNPLVTGPDGRSRRRLAPIFGAVLGDPDILGEIRVAQSTNRSRYDELAVKLERRARKATFQFSYTFSRSFAFGGLAADNNLLAQDQDNMFGPGEWGPTQNDERHRVVLLGVFELPWWGIQLAPVLQAASARPYNRTAGVDLNRDGLNNDRFIDPATGRPVSINSARGDAFFLTDLRATKFFRFQAERMQLGLFTEFFNLLNTVNFGNNFNGNARSTQFRKPVGFIGGIGTGSPFQAQFGARLSF